jgi:aminoglycoside phosphotransferase (APT) family kinase protein
VTAGDPPGVGVTAGDPPGLDLARLGEFLRRRAPELSAGDGGDGGGLRAEVIVGGKSNLTYVVDTGARRLVLRRPPLGHVLATAHDMSREYRVLHALASSAVPVPRALLHCADPEVIGAPFYLMSHVDGAVFRDPRQLGELTAADRRAVADNLVDVLADLHDVDPAAVGLADFGRPEGFLQRQVRRWKTQLDASRSRALPGIDDLHAELAAAVPTTTGVTATATATAAGIVHGDYRLDNVLIDPAGRVAAVLDWEMAALGDPLADLGLLLVYWDGPAWPAATALAPHMPSGSELVARYARRRPVELSRLDWYVALGCFKLAVIAEGIHYRHLAGQTVGAGFDDAGDMVAPLVEQGRAALAALAAKPATRPAASARSTTRPAASARSTTRPTASATDLAASATHNAEEE